jgi:hypothetical protein
VVVALLAVRLAVTAWRGKLEVLAVATAMAAWVAFLSIAYRRARNLRWTPPRGARRAIGAAALTVAGYALIGAVLILR